MQKHWVKIYETTFGHMAEIARAMLIEDDINAIVVNKMDSMHTSLMNAEIEVYVDQDHALRAKHLISKNAL